MKWNILLVPKPQIENQTDGSKEYSKNGKYCVDNKQW